MSSHKLLVIGLDVAPLAASTKNAGYEVYSVDYFGDLDLKNSCSLSLSVIAQREGVSCGRVNLDFNPQDLLVLVRKLVKTREVDGILISSGLEDYPQVLSALNELAPIIGNSSRTISRVRDKERFFIELNRIGVSHPETRLVENLEEAKRNARDIGYPIIIKPMKGFGGSGIRKAVNPKRLEAILSFISSGESFLIQEYVEGKPASTSVISATVGARTLTVNEQLLGMRSLGQHEPFCYCGNIVPLEISKSVIKQCREISKKVVLHFNLLGSNGVDFVITEENQPKVIEVNPRFQGTLECVEQVLDINLVKAHIESCTLGVLPDVGKARGFCVRLILYALKRSRIPALDLLEGVRDIPFKGVVVEAGEPLCSIVAKGSSRILALGKARKLADFIYRSI